MSKAYQCDRCREIKEGCSYTEYGLDEYLLNESEIIVQVKFTSRGEHGEKTLELCERCQRETLREILRVI